MDETLHLQLIGSPEVRLGATTLRFQRRRSLALLAFLVLTARPHPREALVTLLATDADPAAARQALRTTLAELHALLPHDLLISRHSVAFAPTHPVLLDLSAFQHALAADDLAALQAALDRSSGELLADLSVGLASDFEHWLTLERERWHELRLHALMRLLDHYQQCGAHAAGITVARQLLALAPWCEEAHRQLMQLLMRAGQRTQALMQYQRCRSTLARELGVAPLPATTALYERLRAGLGVVPSNLSSVAAVEVVGRAQEQARLLARLGDERSRLLTLVGLGGMGKSVLARAVAAHLLQPQSLADCSPFPDGVFAVDFAGVAPARGGSQAARLPRRQIAQAIAAALGIALHDANDPMVEVMNHLRSKTLLLVLDNLEHLVEERDLLAALLQAAPGLKLLATSRVRLQLAEEAVLELEGLELPADAAELEQAAASRLFLEWARRSAPNRSIVDSDQRHIARICELVQGHPLAVIRAARRLRTLSCPAIAAELELSFDLLEDQDGELPDRQRSLRQILEWSMRQLADADQAALRRLAVFRGRFEREAVHQVAGVTLLQLRVLCDAALLNLDNTGRYWMPELIRRFAVEPLDRALGEAARPDASHAVLRSKHPLERAGAWSGPPALPKPLPV